MDEFCIVLCSLETFINMDLIDLISSEKITVKEEVYPEVFHFKKLPQNSWGNPCFGVSFLIFRSSVCNLIKNNLQHGWFFCRTPRDN